MDRWSDLTDWKVGYRATYYLFTATRRGSEKFKTICTVIKICKTRIRVQFDNNSTAYVNPENLMRIDETNRR